MYSTYFEQQQEMRTRYPPGLTGLINYTPGMEVITLMVHMNSCVCTCAGEFDEFDVGTQLGRRP